MTKIITSAPNHRDGRKDFGLTLANLAVCLGATGKARDSACRIRLFGRRRMRAFLFGCPIDILTMAETVDRVHEAMRTGRRLQHVALNVAKLVNLRSDPV